MASGPAYRLRDGEMVTAEEIAAGYLASCRALIPLAKPAYRDQLLRFGITEAVRAEARWMLGDADISRRLLTSPGGVMGAALLELAERHADLNANLLSFASLLTLAGRSAP